MTGAERAWKRMTAPQPSSAFARGAGGDAETVESFLVRISVVSAKAAEAGDIRGGRERPQ